MIGLTAPSPAFSDTVAAPAPAHRASDPPAIPCPLPPIPPKDRPLLLRLFALGENYQALANELMANASTAPAGHPKDILDLYDWADQPHIAPWIARHRQMTDLQRRTLALDVLQTVVKTTDSLTEKRRAASTILRALDGNWSRPRERSSSPAPSVASSLRRSVASHPRSYAPPPPPISHPVPNADQHAELQALRAAFNTPQPSVALATIHAHAAHPPAEAAPAADPPSAPSCLRASVPSSPTFAAHPVASDAAEFIAETPSILPAAFRFPLFLADCKEREHSDRHSRWTLWASNTSKESFHCALSLIRDDPDHPNPCWRLATFDILSRSG
jgi:hypothetical protein